MVLLTLWLACTAGGPDDTAGEKDPWDDLEPRALEPLRPLLVAPLTGAARPTRVALLSGRPHAFVLDPDLGRVHVYDDRYRQEGMSQCIETRAWPDFPVDERQQGDCAEGEVLLNRGALEPGGTLHAMAVDTDGLNIQVWAGERLYTASADLLHESPWEILRLDEGLSLAEVPVPVTEGALVGGDGALWFAADAWLGRVDFSGQLEQEWVLPGVVNDLAWSEDRAWVATTGGIWSPEQGLVSDTVCSHLAADGIGGVWWVDRAEEQVHHLDAAGETTAWEVPGATGPVAQDPLTGRLAVAVTGGLTLYEQGTLLASVEGPDVRDLAINAHHEIVAMDGDGLHVFGDEEALGTGDPLALVIAGFVEQPSSPEENLPCLSESDGIAGHLAMADRNRRLVDDLPAGLALGITPQMGRRALACGLVHDLFRVGQGERVEPGVLNHELPEDNCVQDPDCHQDFLASQYADVAASGLEPDWFSGLLIHEDKGADWVENLVATGVTDTYLHFSLSVLPEIDHSDDPRAKQPFPPDVASMTTPLVASNQEDLLESTSGGALRLLPGNSMAAFRLSLCPNLMLWECNAVEGNEVEPRLRIEDIEVLRVQLFRALGARGGPGQSWTFHLPDLGSWDYTLDCSVEDRRWSGEDCQGALLQDWLLDVHARYVQADVVAWTLPRDLPWPD